MANKIQDAFDSIRADDRLKKTTKQFIREEYAKKTRHNHRAAFYKTLAAACMVLFLAAGAAGYSWIQQPVSYVSIDVNPSIELALNRMDRVVSATAFNAEGEEILKPLSLKGKKYTDAIDTVINSKAMDIYLAEEAELVFTVAADKEHNRELQTGVQACSSHSGHSSQNVSADIGIVAKAHDSGLSVGKYYAWLQLVRYDDSVTIDECKKMSISEIHGSIRSHEHNGEHGQGGEQEEKNESEKNESEKNESEKNENEVNEESHDHSGHRHNHGADE